MQKYSLTKEALLFYLFNEELIGKGHYGLVKRFDDETLIKIYYRDIYKTYLTKNANYLDDDIKKNINEMIKRNNYISDEGIKEELKLEQLSKLELIKGIITYCDYKVGILLPYYKDYVSLAVFLNNFDYDRNRIVFNKIKNKLAFLMQNNLYPIDLREDNILIRTEDLDVVIIDLDDEYTRYEDSQYIGKFSYYKDECEEKIKSLKKVLL